MKLIRKPRSIRSILFLTYSSIIVIGIAILFALFYVWSSGLLKTQAFNSISELSSTLQTQLDLEIQKLDSVSVSILYSNLITDRISAYETPGTDNLNPLSSEQSGSRYNKTDTALYDILVALVGPSYPVQQVYLHLFSGISIGVGFDNSQKKSDVANQPWYTAVERDKRTKVITLSKTGDGVLGLKNNVSVSLLRHFSDKYNAPKGIVEVRQSYSKVFSGVIRQTKENPSLEQVLIYTNEGEIVYPYEYTEQDKQIVDQILRLPPDSLIAGQPTFISNSLTSDKDLLTIKHSDLTNWNIAVMISNKNLLSPLNRFTKIAILATLILLIFLIVLSFVASKRITRPLSSLNKTIKSISLESLVTGTTAELNSGLNEWDRLNASFVKMNGRLKESFDQLLLSRTHEMQAKMTALQSQMNPHFLYNSLATISAMAYEQLNEQIIALCDNLSDMMRYISADESSLVDIQTEINYTEMYLNCMKLRYGDMLACSIVLPASIQSIQIPKIIIQPLVENAIKYGTKTSPPWEISIRGTVADRRWLIEVTDNGPGFNDQELTRFYAQVEEMERSQVLPALKLHGMGLLNIYIRLNLQYGNQMYFQIRNLPDRGAVVTIGGPLHSK
ncbi:sensor histidine kinase [Cohnella hashimotonis]|uniref:Sensor histidine kinase n=1 Tax=Cohnella hashimotonis TaxID=2826895 RepID=A0ABT6TMX8_9BACL|nr:sensor histidine kinase [Cohnella hashimotonis]MDI4648095.1 sensor histidine kinase [Cohnella hashimotonis]